MSILSRLLGTTANVQPKDWIELLTYLVATVLIIGVLLVYLMNKKISPVKEETHLPSTIKGENFVDWHNRLNQSNYTYFIPKENENLFFKMKTHGIGYDVTSLGVLLLCHGIRGESIKDIINKTEDSTLEAEMLAEQLLGTHIYHKVINYVKVGMNSRDQAKLIATMIDEENAKS